MSIHKMRLSEPYYTLVKNGHKTIEGRIYDEKRQLLNVDDYIIFTDINGHNEIKRPKCVFQFSNIGTNIFNLRRRIICCVLNCLFRRIYTNQFRRNLFKQNRKHAACTTAKFEYLLIS